MFPHRLGQVQTNILQLLQRGDSGPHIKTPSLPKHSSTVTHMHTHSAAETQEIFNSVCTYKKPEMGLGEARPPAELHYI